MPPKSKAGPKQKDPEPETPPKTLNERTARVHAQGHPYAATLKTDGPSGLSQADRALWANAYFARSPALLKRLTNKSQKDVWKSVNEAGNLPLRAIQSPKSWGRDRFGADLGEYSPEQFAKRSERAVQLAALEVQHRAFLEKRERERGKWIDYKTKGPVTVTPEEIDEEKLRRKEIASLRMELYGERSGAYGTDPEWDDIVPMPVEDGEGALAAIAYPEDYAEAISYLRAVMAKKEYSPRCLRLTQHIISMNPAHYTVWLYRFSIVQALQIPIPEEIEWLNEVSLNNLKNYQIWHHRRLVMDHYVPTIEASPDKVAELAKSEQQFLEQILAEDTKNYHVWSYRQYMVPKLGIFGDSEIAAADELIEEDVRNNSAWSHRFFIVFSDPKHSTPGSLSTEHDPKVPTEIVDREVQYAQAKILLAPQNQSPWNYLRGVLVKGGRPMESVGPFVNQFVHDLGVEDKEKVTSSHGLELLAEIYAEKGETDKAELALRRLGEKWDRIRLGYWQWRMQMLKGDKVGA
ncbi:CAAX geranylgeranyltransferase alpha subunit [Gnomoniopsis sp. IMI 355080]|nr:CAAX geranylgeranyltransferase alpha subunit [Gnomoniopsis sp. IMI 355080]